MSGYLSIRMPVRVLFLDYSALIQPKELELVLLERGRFGDYFSVRKFVVRPFYQLLIKETEKIFEKFWNVE